MDTIHLWISVPIAGFRVAQAREFWETYICPPPSTVYGMLLSLVGEPDRLVHQGTQIAVSLVSEPKRSVVLRTLWRVKDRKAGLGLGANKRPDYQELLTNVQLSVWVRQGKLENAETPLVRRLESALSDPGGVSRFGGLALGESTHLVNEVRPWRATDPTHGRLVFPDNTGDISLPVWVDHIGSRGTLWGQFRLEETNFFNGGPPEVAWVTVRPRGISE